MRSVANLIDRRIMALFLSSVFIGNLSIMVGRNVFASSQSTFELTIQRIRELDQIEALPWSPWLLGQDGADWRWQVQFYNGNQWLPWEKVGSGGDQNPDANQLYQAYSWTFDTPSNKVVKFRIAVWDDDLLSSPDLADLSSKPGEGVGNWNGDFVSGAIFEGVYNLATMSFTSDSDQVKLQYNPKIGRIMYVASGEYDGTYGSGGLDAEVWFEVGGQYPGEAVPSDVAVINVTPLKTFVTSPYPNYIMVDVMNNCSNIIPAWIYVYANNSIIAAEYLVLRDYEQRSFTVVWQTGGFEGTYIISAWARQLPDEIDVSNNRRTSGFVIVVSPEKACAIIVAGSKADPDIQTGEDGTQYDMNKIFNDECSFVYRTLRQVGLSADNICYLSQPKYSDQDSDKDGRNDVSAISSGDNLEWAITVWAPAHVGNSESLFLFLDDHGGTDAFAIAPSSIFPDVAWLAQTVGPAELTTWMNKFEAVTGAHAHLIYDACKSGSFIDELSKDERVVATSTSADEYSYGDLFLTPFWKNILSGHSIGWSFNSAASYVDSAIEDHNRKHPNETVQMHPLLDDNGDGIGNIGPVPNGGDGYLADAFYIGGYESSGQSYPLISHAIPRIFLIWPPPPRTTLWAEIENQTSLEYVRAYMQPPDWSPSLNGTFVNLNSESYEMVDPDHDGNWTVEIASADFTRHATGPAMFGFLIVAEEIDGGITTPSMVTVEFTNGTMPTDVSAPYVFVDRPLTEHVVYEQTLINGTVIDDTCLSRMELWQEITLSNGTEIWSSTQTLNLSETSTSYFEFPLNTTSFSNGPTSVSLRVYDTSGNYRDQNVTFLVNNYVHDITVTDIEAPDIINYGETVCVNVTLANLGSYQETFNVSLYVNASETPIVTQTVNLARENYSTVELVWNAEADYGNYTISAFVSAQNENNTDNNLCVKLGKIKMFGDVNNDDKVNILDVVQAARAYQATPTDSKWDPNADVNFDNNINIMDLALIAKKWWENSIGRSV